MTIRIRRRPVPAQWPHWQEFGWWCRDLGIVCARRNSAGQLVEMNSDAGDLVAYYDGTKLDEWRASAEKFSDECPACAAADPDPCWEHQQGLDATRFDLDLAHNWMPVESAGVEP